MKYWVNLLKSIDQFFNTLAGGNPDVTLSGHIGIMADVHKNWNNLKKMVDFTFLPIEADHCTESFLSDDDLDDTNNFYRTALFSLVGCALLFFPIRLIAYATRKT